MSLFERKSFGIYYKIVFFYIIKIIILNKIKFFVVPGLERPVYFVFILCKEKIEINFSKRRIKLFVQYDNYGGYSR